MKSIIDYMQNREGKILKHGEYPLTGEYLESTTTLRNYIYIESADDNYISYCYLTRTNLEKGVPIRFPSSQLSFNGWKVVNL